MYYVCAGTTNFYPTLSKPLYNFGNTGGVQGKFIDYKDWMCGYQATPQEIGVSEPYPTQHRTADNRLWIKKDGVINEKSNMAFKNEGRQGPVGGSYRTEFGKTFVPPVREKLTWDADPFPGTYNFSNTWQHLKQRGLLKS